MIALGPLPYVFFFLSSYTTLFIAVGYPRQKLSPSQMTSRHGSLSLLHTDITKRATRIFILAHI